MARKLVQKISIGMNTAKVYHDSEWQEFIVEHYQNEVKIEGASYHTDSKQDAIGHAGFWCAGN